MTLLKNDVHQVLRNHLQSEDFEFISCEGSDLADLSIGFLSAQDKACIRYRTRSREEELHIFIKALPQSCYHRENVVSMGGFHREVTLFNELLNRYRERLSSIPQCYLARSDEILILEDMSKRGFKNRDLYYTYDLQHCEKTLDTLAKFHALSFVTERERDCKMTDIVPEIKTEVIMSKNENHVGRRAVLTGIRTLKTVAKLYFSHYPEEVTQKAFAYMDNLFDEMKCSTLYPNVLSHSDLWSNNIMFRYGKDGNVEEACILDFQLATYKSPGYDILLFLHTCTETELRDMHYEDMMKHYYSTLSNQLWSSGIVVEDVLTYGDFQGCLQESLPVALAQAVLFLHFVLMPDTVMKDIIVCEAKWKEFYELERTEYVLEAMKGKEYRRRILQAMANYLNYFSNKM